MNQDWKVRGRIEKTKAGILCVCAWCVRVWGGALVGVCLCAMSLCLCVKGEKVEERQLCML